MCSWCYSFHIFVKSNIQNNFPLYWYFHFLFFVKKETSLHCLSKRKSVIHQSYLLQIGVWKSWQKEGLDIKDIVWPGNSHTPPQGVPEKFHLKITFLEEPPYINLAPPDPVTGKCSMDRGMLCRVASDVDITE